MKASFDCFTECTSVQVVIGEMLYLICFFQVFLADQKLS